MPIKKTEHSDNVKFAGLVKECAQKVEELEKIITTPVTKPPVNNINVEIYQTDLGLAFAEYLCFAAGFVSVGFAIASAIK
jgi:hypothetical protein